MRTSALRPMIACLMFAPLAYYLMSQFNIWLAGFRPVVQPMNPLLMPLIWWAVLLLVVSWPAYALGWYAKRLSWIALPAVVWLMWFAEGGRMALYGARFPFWWGDFGMSILAAAICGVIALLGETEARRQDRMPLAVWPGIVVYLTIAGSVSVVHPPNLFVAFGLTAAIAHAIVRWVEKDRGAIEQVSTDSAATAIPA